jgi:hypothetical protein
MMEEPTLNTLKMKLWLVSCFIIQNFDLVHLVLKKLGRVHFAITEGTSINDVFAIWRFFNLPHLSVPLNRQLYLGLKV